MQKKSDFVGLHIHSQNSFLDGEASHKGIAQRADDLGQEAAALTDHQEVSGHISFYQQCLKLGIKPILGMEGYFHAHARKAKDLKLTPPDYSHITILARNNEGLKNLWAWSTRAYLDNFYHRAIVDWDDMKEFSPGLWASDGCGLGHMASAITKQDNELQHELMGRYLETFGDNFFMELHTFQFIDPPKAINERQVEQYLRERRAKGEKINEKDIARLDPYHKQRRINAELTMMNQRKVELANEYGVPLVVVNDAHYAPPEDWQKHNLVWGMSTAQNTDQTGNGRTASWMMGDEELYFWMDRHGIGRDVVAEAIKNTKMIADDCNVEIKPQLRMPAVNATEEDDIRQFLNKLEEGFKRKVIDKGLDEAPYRARLESEAKVIIDNHFPGYFNVVDDLVRTAKEKDMFVGPGRGSAGGALCSYLMGITGLDPIKYDLLFERFLAPGRGGLPDIDVDLQQSRLGEMKEYTAHRYGHGNCCGIGTFTRSSPKSMVNDLCRALGVEIPETKKISKAIGKLHVNPAHTPARRWNDMLEKKGDRIRPWVNKYPDVFRYGSQMIGMIRQSSVHASGWIISPEPLLGNLPLRRTKDGNPVSQFEQPEIEWLGYVKFDLLGIRHLDTIKYTLDAIKERHGITIDPYEFDDEQYCDPAIWERIGKGDTLGLFQLEADLMADTARKHKPQSEREVAELLAINRPGVIDAGLLDVYIDRKHGREEVSYDHPMMRDIVGNTYGILIYQEDIMKMSKIIAGFSPEDADWLRKVVGKKKVNELPALKEAFVKGCRANQEFLDTCYGSPETTIAKLWTSIEASGEYLFNKSHSVAYALVGTWEAWLRHYYYPEFIAACMRSDPEKVPRYVNHAHQNNVPVLPPDINQSAEGFVLTDDGVRYGLTSVRDVGEVAFKEILRTRPFTSLADMMDKVAKKDVNRRTMTNLIHIGAFDSMNPDRAAVQEEFYQLRKVPPRDRKPVPDYSDLLEMYRLEKELVGSQILYDPLRDYEAMIGRLCLKSPDDIENLSTGDVVKIGGLITKVHPHKTKRGEWMGFLTITHESEDFEILVFSEAWHSCKVLLEIDRPVIARVIKLKDDAVHLSQIQRLDYLSSGK